jgi:hypothetical protein
MIIRKNPDYVVYFGVFWSFCDLVAKRSIYCGASKTIFKQIKSHG